MGPTPARVLERGESVAEERRRPSDRPLERRAVERHGLRPGRLLEQSRGAGGIGPSARVGDDHPLHLTPQPHHEHDGTLRRRDRRAGPGRSGRPCAGRESLEPIAPIEPAGAGPGPGLHAALRDQPALHGQGIGERRRREKRHGLDALMGRARAIDPPHALRKPGGTPGQIVVDHADGILEIQPLAQDIGCDQDVRFERQAGKGSTLRSRRECAEHVLPPRGLLPEPAPLSRHRREAVASEPAHQVMHRGPRLDEDDRLSHARLEQACERVRLGIRQ